MSEVRITVAGATGSGKSAIAGEIEIAMKALGVPVEWKDADREHWTKGNEYWIDLYKPNVTILEENVPGGLSPLPPSPYPPSLRERLARAMQSCSDPVVQNDLREILEGIR